MQNKGDITVFKKYQILLEKYKFFTILNYGAYKSGHHMNNVFHRIIMFDVFLTVFY